MSVSDPALPSSDNPARELVSVIVTTRNSERTLAACLDSIRSQSYPDLELIVVDNESTDLTAAVAQRYCDVLVNKGPERSAQRNYGAALSHGAFVLFIDSDMILEHDVVKEAVSAMEDRDTRGVVIPEVSFGEGFWTQCKALERSCYVGDDDVEAARLFRRTDFLEAGGYDEDLLGAEDWDVSTRVAGRKALPRTTSVIRHDEGRINPRDCYRKRRYYAPGYLRYLQKHRSQAVAQGNALVRPAFARHWRQLARRPVLTVGLFVLKAVEFSAVAGVAIQSAVLPLRNDR